MPSPPPKPAREFAGQAFGPIVCSNASLQTPVPSRSSVTPAGPYTFTCLIGEGTGPVVDPIVALPNAFVGIPGLSGEKPASVMLTVSDARAAQTGTKMAQQMAAPARIRVLATIDLEHPLSRSRFAAASPRPLNRQAEE